MWYAMTFIGGLVLGGALGVLAALWRARSAPVARQMEVESRAVRAETQFAEAEKLRAVRDQEVESLRGQLALASTQRAEAVTRLEESQRNLEEQKRALEKAGELLRTQFEALSASALKSNSDEFLKIAKATMGSYLESAKGDLGKREEAVKALVNPLADKLGKLDEQVRAFEVARGKAFGELRQYLESVSGTQEQLQAETRKLVSALREPRARGRWGELTLRRVVEVAGMSDHCDFVEQVSVDSEDGRQRPDMVIHLPGGRRVVVDAKAPMDAYLAALSAEDEEARKEALANHARQIRLHLAQLGGKRYWDQFEHSPEMVVLFVPGESFFSAALDCDHSLIEDGAGQRVILASPTTLIALLRAVSYGWQQERLAASAQHICDLGRELYDRIRAMADNLADMQRSLRQTVERFNKTVGSLEMRVLPSARRFKELGAGSSEEIVEIEPITETPRELPGELRGGGQASLPA